MLRYSAIIYPLAIVVVYVLSEQAIWKKIVSIGITFLVILEVENSIVHKTEEATGTATFSAFGGWQLANNTVYVLEHVKPDSAEFSAKTSKEINVFIKNFYDSLTIKNFLWYKPGVNSQFMWMNWSPLKRYMNYYINRCYATHPPPCGIVHYIPSWDTNGPVDVTKQQTQYIIATFTTMGPVFEDFGIEVIKKYPLQYLRYFVWPNFKIFCQPPVELYNYYNNSGVITGHIGTLGSIENSYYDYSSNTIDLSNAGLFPLLMEPWSWLFPFINAIFILLTAAYYITRSYKNDKWFNRCLILYLVFYLSNILLNIALITTLFRYYIIIVTLSMVFIIYLWQRVFNAIGIFRKNGINNY